MFKLYLLKLIKVGHRVKEYNGGKIIDDELVQQNGFFIPKSLQPLNKVKKLERN